MHFKNVYTNPEQSFLSINVSKLQLLSYKDIVQKNSIPYYRL